MFIFESQDVEGEIQKSNTEYTYDEMKNFLEEVINYMDTESGDRTTYINIPYDRNASSVVYDLKKDLLPAFEKFNNQYSKENPLYYVWNYTDTEGKYKGTNHFDINEILNIAKEKPGFIKSIKISFDSKDQRQFAKDMSAGVYGDLD